MARFFAISGLSMNLMNSQAASGSGDEVGMAQPQEPFRPPPGTGVISILPATCELAGSS
jgi:hypothetical protein